MSADSIIGSITDYISACPLLKDGVFRVDALGNEPCEYCIEVAPFDPVVQRYIDGSELRQYQFNFSSREYYSMDRAENIQNSSFYEKFSAWIESQNLKEIYPDLPEGCEAQQIEALSSGYLFDASMVNARYQIQLRLVYFKEVSK